MKIKNFTRDNIRNTLRPNLQRDLDRVAKKFGISLRLGNISFTSETINIKLEGGVIAKDGNVITKKAMMFQLYAKKHGIKFKVGDTFKFRNEEYTISGWNTRASRYPIEAIGEDGRTYKFAKNTSSLIH